MAGLCLPLPTFAADLAVDSARLGAGAMRVIFTVEDFHLILLAGLPAHPCYCPVPRAAPIFAQPLVIQIDFPAKTGPETANSPCFLPVIREYQGVSGRIRARSPLLMTLP